MKKLNPISFLVLALTLVFSTSLFAQEKTEVSVKIKKEGRVIMDTTYQYDDDADAKHAVKMLEIFSENDEEVFDIFIDEEDESGEKNRKKRVKVIVSDDEHGNWIAKEEEHVHGDNVEVIVIKKKIKKKPKEQ